MIRSKKYSVLLLFISLSLLIMAEPVQALTVDNLKDIKIVGHYFTTRISNGRRTITVKNPSISRFMVLILTATLEGNGGKMFSNDFTLKYFHGNGKEDRAKNETIALTNPDFPYLLRNIGLGDVTWNDFDKGQINFGLVFMVEPDVREVELYRIGSPDKIAYTIGDDRSYSVYITTNNDSGELAQVRDVIVNGGYHVTGATNLLVKSEKGITIHYADKAETAAREISQRLMTTLNKTPKLEKIKLIGTHDIVVWLGK